MTAFYPLAICSYLLGSIPFGYLLVRVFRGGDIRERGSGNIGATNVARTSPVLGLITLLLDAAKGYLAVYCAILLWQEITPFPTRPMVTLVASVAGCFAVLGHVFPVWLKFRGGKGVATALGSFVWLAPKSVLAMIAIFAISVLLTRYVSLGSILAVGCFPLLAWRFDFPRHPPQAVATVIVSATCMLIVARHYANLRRLRSGTENKLWRRR